MSEHLAWQFFVTRWLILAAIALVVGLVANGVTMARGKKDTVAYNGRGFWWLIFLGLAGMHIGAFLYHRDLPHWMMSIGAGLITGFCGAMLLRGVAELISVKAVRWSTVISAAAFAVIANYTPLEATMIGWFGHM